MYLVTKRLLRMSAMRNAIQLSILFLLIMLIAGFMLRIELSRQVYEEIDHDLQQYSQLIHQSFSQNQELQKSLFTPSNHPHFSLSAGFLSEDGNIKGQLRPEVFKQLGIHSLTSTDLFKHTPNESKQESDTEMYYPQHLSLLGVEDEGLWRVQVSKIESGTIAVYTPLHEAEDVLSLLSSIMTPITIVLVIITLSSGCILGLIQQKRITRIQNAFLQLSTGNLSFRLKPNKSRDDLDDLMEGFDNAAKQLETSIHQMSSFSRNIAHELRTPLTELRGALESAKDLSVINIAIEKVDRIIRIFDAVLRISKLGKINKKTTLEPTSLSHIAQILYDLYAETISENKQQLQIELGTESNILGDRQLLMQLGSNLIENAMKYAGPKAKIIIKIEANSFSVIDNGPGLSLEKKEQLLKPYLTSNSSQSARGTGLGLALVNAIVDYHQGTISMNETPGGGLTIQVIFSNATDKNEALKK